MSSVLALQVFEGTVLCWNFIERLRAAKGMFVIQPLAKYRRFRYNFIEGFDVFFVESVESNERGTVSGITC